MPPLTPDTKYPLAQRHFDDAANDEGIYGDVPYVPEDFQPEAKTEITDTVALKPLDFCKLGLM